MEDHSSPQPFANLHHHCLRPSFHLTLPGLQSPELVYHSAPAALDPLEPCASRREESATSFPTTGTSSVGRRASGGGDRGLLHASGSSLDGDANLGGHLDEESGLGGHFADTWFGVGEKEHVWEDGESCGSAADDFYSNKGSCYSNANNVFHSFGCGNEEGVRRKLSASYSDYAHAGYEAKSETAYKREANVSHFANQATSFNRSAAGSFSDSSVDFCRSDSRVSDNYPKGEEDYGSSCGSGEDQLQPAEAEGPWLSVSPLVQRCLPISSGTYTQKLDSFSEAFLSQRKRRFPVIPSGDSPGQIWELGRAEIPGLVKSRHSCAFDLDPYLPPSSSSSPAHPSLASFPSPPTSSHLMSSVLSPPPTPRPPPSYSPSKTESPTAINAAPQGGESLAVQFFSSRLQSLPSIHSAGMIWKFPLVAHSLPQTSGDPRSVEANLRPSHGGDYGNITASQNNQSSFVTSLQPPGTLCPSSAPSLHPSFHLPSQATHHYEAAEKTAPRTEILRLKNGSANLHPSQIQPQTSQIHSGTPFPSILHSSSGQKRHHYTPRPLLNPARRGEGLYFSLSSLHHREEETAGGEKCGVLPCVNVGRDFQAELPPCSAVGEGSGVRSPKDETPREQLLWKPWDKLEESTNSQDQVERLMSMCSSSCLPGGGSNTELALHCLHYCQGDTMATLEMLLFSEPFLTGDYHYSGSDSWTGHEKSLFGAALGTHGKEFSLIQKMVRTKTVHQCVEYFYLSKRLQDKQEKQKQQEMRDVEMERQKSITPICQPVNRQFGREEAVPVPSLASFFPCKLCGKMFYKIKSRNAHMKIHRQPQEDWADRRLQHQLLTQRLGSNLLPPQAPAQTFSSSGLPVTTSNDSKNVLNSVTNGSVITPNNGNILNPNAVVTYSNIAVPNSHTIINSDGGDSNQREPATILPFHQSWGSFGQDAATFYCNAEGKADVMAGTEKEPISWQ